MLQRPEYLHALLNHLPIVGLAVAAVVLPSRLQLLGHRPHPLTKPVRRLQPPNDPSPALPAPQGASGGT